MDCGEQEKDTISVYAVLWPFFSVLQCNDDAALQFLPVKNRVSSLYGDVFPSVLQCVQPQGNAQPQGTPGLLLPRGHARRSDKASISGTDPRT